MTVQFRINSQNKHDFIVFCILGKSKTGLEVPLNREFIRSGEFTIKYLVTLYNKVPFVNYISWHELTMKNTCNAFINLS